LAVGKRLADAELPSNLVVVVTSPPDAALDAAPVPSACRANREVGKRMGVTRWLDWPTSPASRSCGSEAEGRMSMRSIRLSATLRLTFAAARIPLPARNRISASAEAASACIVASRAASAGPSSQT
jgi:hypothetical protein